MEHKYISSLITIMQKLIENPDIVVINCARLEEESEVELRRIKNISSGHTEVANDVGWTSVERGNNIPKWHLWSWISKKVNNPELLTPSFIEKIDRVDRLGVRKITELHTGVGSGTRVPLSARVAKVFFKLMDERYAEIDRSLFVFFQSFVDFSHLVVSSPEVAHDVRRPYHDPC